MSLLQTAKDAGMLGMVGMLGTHKIAEIGGSSFWLVDDGFQNCRKSFPGKLPVFFGGIGFHFFGIIHWRSLSTPSPWRVSHLVFLSTSTTRTNQKNAACRSVASKGAPWGVNVVEVVPNTQKKQISYWIRFQDVVEVTESFVLETKTCKT